MPSTPRVRTAIDLPSTGPILACDSGPADSTVSAYLQGLRFRTNHSELHTTKMVRDSLSHNERGQPQRVGTSMEGAPPKLRRFSVSENIVSSEVLLESPGFGALTPMTPMAAQPHRYQGNTTLGLSKTWQLRLRMIRHLSTKFEDHRRFLESGPSYAGFGSGHCTV